MKKNSQGKKLISFALVFALLISLFSILPLTASAADVGTTFTVDDIVYKVIDENNVAVDAQYSGSNTDVTIPDKVENESVTYTVTQLNQKAFNAAEVEIIRLPNTIKTVNKYAIYKCAKLNTVYINSDVQFASRSFAMCTALKDIYCNSDNIVFAADTFLAKGSPVTINKDLVFYGKTGCSAEEFVKQNADNNYTFKATDVEEESTTEGELGVGDSFTEGAFTYTIGEDNTLTLTTFDGSTKNVVIPETVNHESVDYKVTAIKCEYVALEGYKGAFAGNTEIESVEIPGSIKVIVKGTFNECTALNSVKFNEGLETIDGNSFNSTALKEVKFPKSVKKIAYSSFAQCKSLTKIEVNSDAEIGNGAFQNSMELTDCYFYTDFPSFDNSAFSIVADSKLIFHANKGSLAEIFATQKGIKFEPLNPDATTVTDNSNFIWAKIDDGKAVEIKGFKPDFMKTENLEIPSDINGIPVTSIGANAFASNESIKTLSIPASVTNIGSNAFNGCKYLTEVTFAADSHLETIGERAFMVVASAADSDYMTEISLPESLKQIGKGAFANRTKLKKVYIYSSDVEIGVGAQVSSDDVFYGINRINIYGHKGSTTETYCTENKLSFHDIDQAETTKPVATTEATEATTAAVETTAATEATTVDAEPTETTAVAETTVPGGTTIEVLLGDADSSGKVDVKDVTYIQKHIASYFTLEGTPALAADVDGNGTIDVNDATLVQKYLASYNVDYKIGEVVQLGSDTPAPTADTPQPTEVQSTTAAQDPTTAEPEPTTATTPEDTDPDDVVPEGSIKFYVTNYVSWLDRDGCKLWVYNEDTNEVKAAKEYDKNTEGLAGYFYFYIPEDWVNLSIYRTAFDVTDKTFDRNSIYNEATGEGIIINKWEKLPARGDNNSFKVTSDGQGNYTMFDPNEKKPEINERTIYFDNSQTKWKAVYIYGWSFGLEEVAVEMEDIGDDYWSYTFYDELPIDGVQGFLFTDRETSKSAWTTGTVQTVDLATEEGKNLFVPNPGTNQLTGTWDVYEP